MIVKKIKKFESIIDNNYLLFIFSLIFYGLIIYLAATLNIWEDELYSLNTSSKSLTYALHQSLTFEAQPPVYFMLLTLWRLVSSSVLWARMLSVFFILLSQIILYDFSKKYTNKKVATIFTMLFLLNPIVIFSILEIRLYSLIVFSSLLIFINFYTIYFNEKPTYKNRSIFIFLAIAGVFTQFFIGFLLFSNAVVLLLGRKTKSFWIYILDMIIPLCLLLVYFPYVQSNMSLHSALLPAENVSFIEFSIESFRLFMLKTSNYLMPFDFDINRIYFWVFRIGIFIFLILSLNLVELKNKMKNLMPFIISSLVIYFCFFMVYYLLGTTYSQNKYSLVLFIPLFLFVVMLFKCVKPVFLNFWFIILATLFTINTLHQFPGLYKMKDYKSVSHYLQTIKGKDEPIFVFRNISAEIITLYFNGNNKIIPIPERFHYDHEFGPVQWDITQSYLITFGTKVIDYENFSVVIDDSPLAGFNESKIRLMSYLQNNFDLKEEKIFHRGITIYECYRRKPNLNHSI